MLTPKTYPSITIFTACLDSGLRAFSAWGISVAPGAVVSGAVLDVGNGEAIDARARAVERTDPPLFAAEASALGGGCSTPLDSDCDVSTVLAGALNIRAGGAVSAGD